MESPAVVGFVVVYLLGRHAGGIVSLTLAGLWLLHDVHRAFAYPLRMRTKGKRMPVVVAVLAFAFDCLNAYVVGRWISHLGTYETSWLADPRFVGGAGLFLTGMTINRLADRRLIALRTPGETGYSIPRGGLFDYVTSPNDRGEIVEWFGYALATWSVAGLAFAVFTVANLAPRAFAHRRWYRETFPDYPEERKALLPYLL